MFLRSMFFRSGWKAFSFLICLSSVLASNAVADTVGFENNAYNVNEGDSFNVVVMGTEFDGSLCGGGINVNFDAAILELQNVTINSNWEFANQSGVISNTTGSVSEVLFSSFNGNTGDFPIATLQFKALAEGVSNLQLSGVASDPFASAGSVVPVSFSTSSVTVTDDTPSVPEVDVPMPIVSSIAILLSLMVIGIAALKRRRSSIHLSVLFIAAGCFSLAQPQSAFAVDSDSDGVDDLIDNCLERANPSQTDSDGDSFGNACDQDYNNDSMTDDTDKEILRADFYSSNANLDANGDGRVNALDLGFFKLSFGNEPGPNNIAPSETLINNPPEVTEVNVNPLETPGPNGENVIVTFKVSDPDSVENGLLHHNVEGLTVVFNDQGVGNDAEAGDGVFTAATIVDLAQVAQDEEQFMDRLGTIQEPMVKEFAGRYVSSEEPFTLNQNTLQFSAITKLLLPFLALPTTTNAFKTLSINNTSVVAHPGYTYDPCDTDGTGNNTNPNNLWSFKTLLANMNHPSTGMTDQEFIHNWLLEWVNNQNVNNFTINARPAVQNFFLGWNPADPTTLDIDNLPFRLLAIMNRIDLASVSYGGASGGEIRFVFGLLDRDVSTCAPATAAEHLTVILEYGDTAETCTSIKSRAQQWIALNGLTLGSVAYMNQLEAITNDVTLFGSAPGKPNDSALNQLRTNDFAFDGNPTFSGAWELREFVIQNGASLDSATIKQTPDPVTFRNFLSPGNVQLGTYVEQNANQVICENHTVPLTFPTSPAPGNAFLGANALYAASTFWELPINPANLPANILNPATVPSCYQSPMTVSGVSFQNEIISSLRHKLSVNACDDCHGNETNTFFTHVNPDTRAFSGFLTGITVTDPIHSGGGPGLIEREFDDLDRRGQILDKLAMQVCGIVAPFSLAKPFTFVH